jgi:hypothetical protein
MISRIIEKFSMKNSIMGYANLTDCLKGNDSNNIFMRSYRQISAFVILIVNFNLAHKCESHHIKDNVTVMKSLLSEVLSLRYNWKLLV